MARISFSEYCYNQTVGKGIDPKSLDMEQAKIDYERDCPELKSCVFLDDFRIPTAQIQGYERWVLIRNFAEWVEYLSMKGVPDLVSFDHDLADEHYQDFQKYELEGIAAINYDDFKQQSGYECAQYLVAFCQQNDLEIKAVGVHCTERAMGAHNIRAFINAYKESQGQLADCYIAEVPCTTIEALVAKETVSNLKL